MASQRNVFLFLVWSRARPFDAQIEARLARDFRVLHSVEIQWPRRGFTRRLRGFYGFGGWFVWWNKARRCGRGPFRVIVIEDLAPVWKKRHDTRGRELLVDERVYAAKRDFRALTRHSNIVHSSVTAEETDEQLRALFGCGTETFLERLATATGECLGEGHRRICHRLAEGGECLKSYMTDAELASRAVVRDAAARRPIRDAVRREIVRARFIEDENTCAQEYRMWLDLRRRLPEKLMRVFPSRMELVSDPVRGWCVRESCVLNADGSAPLPFLAAYRAAESAERRDRLLSAICELRDALCAWRVSFFDPPNVLVQELADGGFRLRIVDFEPAERTWIPVDRLSPLLCAMKTRRRFNRFLAKLPVPEATHVGWSSHVYPLEAADVAALADLEGTPVPATALPSDEVIVYVRPDGPDALLRGRAKVERTLAERGPRSTVEVRVVFKPSVGKWNLPGTLVRVVRNRYRYHGTAVYHISAHAVRAMGLERMIRSVDEPQKRGNIDRHEVMRALQESLRTRGYDDARPINVMLCRTGGIRDSIRQGHHRISACLACGVDRMALSFIAAGALPRVLTRWRVPRAAGEAGR